MLACAFGKPFVEEEKGWWLCTVFWMQQGRVPYTVSVQRLSDVIPGQQFSNC